MSSDIEKRTPVSCVWVLAASPDPLDPFLLRSLPHPDVVVAADGGTDHAARLGITPDLVVGDLDSSDPRLVAALEAQGVQIARYRHEVKLETDTELALIAALNWQPETIILVGALGGRLDHSIANILLLTNPLLARQNVRLVEGSQVAMLAHCKKWNPLPASKGDTVTLLPVGVAAHGVVTRGLEYPLNGETLQPGSGRGVSNVALESEPAVYYTEGVLLVAIVPLQYQMGLQKQQEEKNG